MACHRHWYGGILLAYTFTVLLYAHPPETFGSTCHGAGRALSRNKSRNNLGYQDVLSRLADDGISIRVASPKLVMEEAPESYKDVTQVVDTCQAAGISNKVVRLRPIAVIKG